MFNNNIRKEIVHLRRQGLEDNEVIDKLSEEYKNIDLFKIINSTLKVENLYKIKKYIKVINLVLFLNVILNLILMVLNLIEYQSFKFFILEEILIVLFIIRYLIVLNKFPSPYDFIVTSFFFIVLYVIRLFDNFFIIYNRNVFEIDNILLLDNLFILILTYIITINCYKSIKIGFPDFILFKKNKT